MPPLAMQCDETHVAAFVRDACRFVREHGMGRTAGRT